MFSSASGSAASLEAVEKAIRNGSRTARQKRPQRNAREQRHRAQHHDDEDDQRGVQRQDQLAQSEQHAQALAADGDAPWPRPRRAAPGTSRIWCSGTSLPPAIRRNATTGSAFAPMAAQAAPNRNANTTICSTSPRAMASIMLAGKVCSSMPPKRGRRLRQAGFRGGAFECHALRRAAPGSRRANPRNSAMVVSTSK